jgi:hypothetical protein
MTSGRHAGRKTSRIVRLPATKLAKIQKRLRKGPVPNVKLRKGKKPV